MGSINLIDGPCVLGRPLGNFLHPESAFLARYGRSVQIVRFFFVAGLATARSTVRLEYLKPNRPQWAGSENP